MLKGRGLLGEKKAKKGVLLLTLMTNQMKKNCILLGKVCQNTDSFNFTALLCIQIVFFLWGSRRHKLMELYCAGRKVKFIKISPDPRHCARSTHFHYFHV